ncbi:MAG: alcohol dehydrogenase catalytic domain-containing protein [Microbacterium sp.]
MKITGAILKASGLPRPYRDSRPIEVVELDLDDPEDGEVLVRIEVAGICHSDLSVVDGSRIRSVPLLLGHEAAGRIEKLGAQVEDLAVGQRVVMTFLPRCGDCDGCRSEGRLPCRRGSEANGAGTLLRGGTRLHRAGMPIGHHLGVSAFATHAVVDRSSVVAVDDDVPPTVAALLGCAVLTGGGALLNEGRPADGDAVVVVGLGGVGMSALIAAVGIAGLGPGHGPVIGVDAQPDKLQRALSLGAARVFSPEEAVAAKVKAPIVIEAAGSARALETAIDLTAPGGRTVTVGLPAPDAEARFSPLALVAEARSIVGSYLGSAVPQREIATFIRLWRAGRLPVEELISHHIRLEDINQAMEDLADGTAMRQIIEFS